MFSYCATLSSAKIKARNRAAAARDTASKMFKPEELCGISRDHENRKFAVTWRFYFFTD
jgi:hypothetical protein